MVGRRPDGKPDVREVYGETRAEVQRKLNALRQRSEAGQLGAPAARRETLGAFLTRWLDTARSTVRPRTWQRYEELVRLHVIPMLGRTRLEALRPDDLQRLYAAKLASSLSRRTVRHIHMLLHGALNQAVRWGYASRNVADAVDPPSVPEEERPVPAPVEVARLLDTARAAGDRLAPLWTVAVYSGCREGELLGLRWEDVDLQRGTLSVRRTLVGAHGGVPSLGEPKTRGSRRTVTLPQEALEALSEQRRQQEDERRARGQAYAPYGFVFASRLGTPLLARNVIRTFKAALKRAGLPRNLRIHDLRHTSATLMLAAGVHPKTASARLGHSAVGITLDRYTHSVQGLDADAAQRIQRAVRGPGTRASTDDLAEPDQPPKSDESHPPPSD